MLSPIGEETLEDQPDDAIFDIKYDEKVGSDENFITDIENYKSSLSFYPLHKIIKWFILFKKTFQSFDLPHPTISSEK